MCFGASLLTWFEFCTQIRWIFINKWKTPATSSKLNIIVHRQPSAEVNKTEKKKFAHTAPFNTWSGSKIYICTMLFFPPLFVRYVAVIISHLWRCQLEILNINNSIVLKIIFFPQWSPMTYNSFRRITISIIIFDKKNTNNNNNNMILVQNVYLWLRVMYLSLCNVFNSRFNRSTDFFLHHKSRQI